MCHCVANNVTVIILPVPVPPSVSINRHHLSPSRSLGRLDPHPMIFLSMLTFGSVFARVQIGFCSSRVLQYTEAKGVNSASVEFPDRVRYLPVVPYQHRVPFPSAEQYRSPRHECGVPARHTITTGILITRLSVRLDEDRSMRRL